MTFIRSSVIQFVQQPHQQQVVVAPGPELDPEFGLVSEWGSSRFPPTSKHVPVGGLAILNYL